MIRQPIISVLGHVDHGKTTLLDYIRKSAVARRESGGITQHIGATEVPIEVVQGICGDVLKTWKITIPGLLFIDTPGHRAFVNLRTRGGSLADLAVLIVDVNDGFQPQTLESIAILKRLKTPFVVAANKIDRLGWKGSNVSFVKSVKDQADFVLQELEEKMWSLIGDLSLNGYEADRFDRIKDFTERVAIVPISAKNGVGVSEILMLIAGLAQRFLEKKLALDLTGEAKGTILEVKEEVGMGTTIDVILYDGTLNKGDAIVLGGMEDLIFTKVRALLKPMPLDEIRDPRQRFQYLDSVSAACGVKISAPALERALAGAPLYIDTPENRQKIREEIQKIRIEKEALGVVIRADTLGTLEALVSELKDSVAIRKADVGEVGKTDVMEALSVRKEDYYLGVIFAFNTKVTEEARRVAEDNRIKIFEDDVIYRLTEGYAQWVEQEKLREMTRKRQELIFPCKFKILPEYIFRTTKPAIVGVEILLGTLKPKYDVITAEGKKVGTIKSIKSKDEFLSKVQKGEQVAVSIEGPTVGRQISEEEVLYSDLPKEDYKILLKSDLSEDERQALEEIDQIKRKHNEFWYL
ncbi:MAG: translation initiation factor IF-2 [Theionarchaea archaeon]|nr:translation initiation factor IF-2 [Theionarchaea archaeon]MBU7001255.1 translation initiation factor IF-2 [Theionarchaea archaeon]MBU7019864.1 translation initiation factor IF-2 [Theionarchaea archaeon]MBU7035264.1 translation initiation factor IF-2 [Theionarchaea archaeon]MBU7040924.1 translation initiation factor IF-2 [Theionarchaea archaeon]